MGTESIPSGWKLCVFLKEATVDSCLYLFHNKTSWVIQNLQQQLTSSGDTVYYILHRLTLNFPENKAVRTYSEWSCCTFLFYSLKIRNLPGENIALNTQALYILFRNTYRNWMVDNFWDLEVFIVQVKIFGFHYVQFFIGRGMLLANLKYKCVVFFFFF